MLLSLMMVLALLIVACGGDEEEEPAEEVTTTEEEVVEEEAAEEEEMAEEEEVAEEEMAEEEAAEEEVAEEEAEEEEAAEEEAEEEAAEEMEETMEGVSCDEPVKVGLITDGTGALAVYGAHIWRSFMLGMEYATGAPGSVGEVFAVADERNTFTLDNCEIEVILGDDQTNPELTATIAREMIEVEDVDVLVGTVSSGATATLQEIAAENQTPLIVAPAASSDITGINFNEYTFRTSRQSYQDAIPLCNYLTQDYSTFVSVVADYSFGWAGAAAYRDACQEGGGEFVADDVTAPLATTEFTPYMEQVLDSGAEVWLVAWAGGGFVPLFQTALDLGVFDEMTMGSPFVDNLTLPSFFANAIGTTSPILYHYTAPDNEINDWLTEQDMARYGMPPDLFDADGMNAAIMLVEGLKATGGDASATALMAAWEGLEFEGPKGTVYIRPEDHVAIQDMYVMTLTNLDDPTFKFFEYVSTMRPEPPCLLPEELKDRCGDLPYGSLAGE
jgi:branched-chain amino acid transport system substrate-binding protein